MLDLIIRLFTWYHLRRLHSRGERIVSIELEPIENTTHIEVTSIRGYLLTFYCRKITYTFTYTNSNVVETHSVYRLYGETKDTNVPETLVQAIKHEVYLPRIFPIFTDEDTSRKLMLNIYVGVIKDKMN